uniref:Uncharacterized protein n=1 Tax=Candidatus Kentrum sp. LFY TaxID=2126342 RepID=A0A450V1G7_9GAMM|nr:MAG: hypothetical protein BECKLFY1418A_GA0070994_10861 [Candidatus Kentron sp. LFY]
MLRVGEQLFQEMIVWVGDIVAQWIYRADNCISRSASQMSQNEKPARR